MNSLLLFKELLVKLNMKDSKYSIKDLENLTKIKAHTIRIWEQRYGILNPQRTPTNIRYYVDSDLRKILNVNLLYTNGYKISKIAHKDAHALNQFGSLNKGLLYLRIYNQIHIPLTVS